MRSITAPFMVAPPAGARVRTRLRPSQQDAVVLRLVGEYLGGLAGGDLARRCVLGPGADGRTDRKRALTTASSSRWAGAITRTSNDQWQRGWQNLLDARAGLRRASKAIERRLQVPVGGRHGWVRGYPSLAERHENSAVFSTCRRVWRGWSADSPGAACQYAGVGAGWQGTPSSDRCQAH